MVIYKTTNTVNGKIYIGKNATNDPEYLGSGDYLRRAIKKYGRDKFVKEILETCPDEKTLDERERYWIAVYDSTDERIGYNLTDGGSGGDTTKYYTPEEKADYLKRRSEAAVKWFRSEEGRKACAENTKKIWQRPGYREKMSQKMMGRKITWGAKMAEGQRRYYETHERKPVSEERRRQISMQHKGKPDKHLSDEIERRIVDLYQKMGPKRMERLFESEGLDVSQYLIVRTLKKHGIYQKWRKGIGHKRYRGKKTLDERCKDVQTQGNAIPQP